MKGVAKESEICTHLDFVQDRPFNDMRYSMDSSKVCSLGWSQKVTWQDGMDQTGDIINTNYPILMTKNILKTK